MRVGLLVPKSVGQLGQVKAPVDHGTKSGHRQRSQEILLMFPQSDQQSLQPLLPCHQLRCRHVAAGAGQDPDQ